MVNRVSGLPSFGMPQQVTPEEMAQPVVLWSQPDGMSTVGAIDSLTPEQASLVTNLFFGDSGKYEGRYAMRGVGTGGNVAVNGLFVFVSSAGTIYPIRFTLTGIDVYDVVGGVWHASVGTALSGTRDKWVTATCWGSNIIFCNQVDRPYTLDPVGLTHTILATAPVCRQLTTYNGRVVASYILTGGTFPSRIQWSIKNDSTDWASAGSGFEDLISSPGGFVDQQVGVYPISDTFALVVRSSSIWGMGVTGYVDAPFSFSFMYPGLGTLAPQSVVVSPLGIILLGIDDVYIISQTGYSPIGTAIRDQLITLYSPYAIGAYNQKTREYILFLPTVLTSNIINPYPPAIAYGSNIWRCKLDPSEVITPYRPVTGKWTKCVYPNGAFAGAIERIAVGLYQDPTSGIQGLDMYFEAFTNTGPYAILAERKDVSSDQTTTPGFDTATGAFTLVSGVVRADPDTGAKTLLVEVQIDHTSAFAGNATVTVSGDGGATFQAYGSAVLAQTSYPTTVAVRGSAQFFEGNNLVIKVVSDVLTRSIISGIRAYVSKGGRKVW